MTGKNEHAVLYFSTMS